MDFDFSGTASLVVAIGSLVPSIIALLAYLESRRTTRKVDVSTAKVDVVENIVTSQRAAMAAEIDAMRTGVAKLEGDIVLLKSRLDALSDPTIHPRDPLS